jgi:F0F1-type ATP synthase assembly protein I
MGDGKSAIYLRKRDARGLTAQKGRGYTSAPMAGSGRDGAWAGMGIGWAVTATLVGGIAVWGSLGYVADRLLGLNPRVLTAVGIVLGAVGAIYLVYLRFGKGEDKRGGA